MPIFNNSRLEGRVSKVEVQVNHIVDDLRSVKDAVTEGFVDLKTLIETRTRDRDKELRDRDDHNLVARRFTIQLLTSIFIGSLVAICGAGSYLTTSVIETRIHPIDKELIITSDRITAIEREIKWSQAMARKEIDDTQTDLVRIYQELSAGKHWESHKKTFPAPDKE